MAMMKVTAISDIVCGKIEFNVTARVINIWAIPDRNNTAEEGSIHMLLVDAKGGKIQASIRKNLIPKFKSEIEEGFAYAFENFMVATNEHSYKATEHKYKLNFMHSTKVFKISTKDIPVDHFDFMPFPSILAATREDKLLDIIGHVVEKDVVKETEKNGQAPMMHKHCFEAVDRTFKDIMQNKDIPFGGKVVVLGGDFRQILPVVPKGTRQQIVRYAINSSYLWNYCEVLTLTTNMRLLSGSTYSDIEERKKILRVDIVNW